MAMTDGRDHVGGLLDDFFGSSDLHASAQPVGTQGIPTGFTDYDRATGGLLAGQLTVVTGASGAGKSTLVLNFAQSALEHGRSVLYAEPVGDREVIIGRLLGDDAAVDTTKIRIGRLGEEDWQRVQEARRELADTSLHIAHPAITWGELIGQIRRAVFSHDLAVLVVDGLAHLIDTVDIGRAGRPEIAARLIRDLHRLALEHQIAVVVTCPLARPHLDRLDKRPRCGDLAETEALEHEADVLVALYRDQVHDHGAPPERGTAEAILLKNRYGPTGTVKLAFSYSPPRFEDLDRSSRRQDADGAGWEARSKAPDTS